MIEVADNALQLIVAACCAGISGVRAAEKRNQSHLLTACFFGTYALGQLYWLVYLVLKDYTPKIFYVSDLSWIASFVFLLTLQIYIAPPEERKFRCGAVWLSPVIGVGLMIFYMQWGDYVTNFLWCGMTSAVGWFALRGLIWSRRQTGVARERQYFHAAALLIVAMEYCLWTSSCFWAGETLANPYFWFDFGLSAALALLLPAVKKAVDA